ncbi:hypothetical protein [Streptomyces roseolus]|uniref:hypothetical protein n=1 Tax=Streptomyces roseolus TaxID=67358 RepID=UPI00167AD0EC|nr:hypothetical protein [Streptomyces roseolus]GGR53834.1 hypothetical protein GCM10010282_53620 [Streptomyces roseolus]
MTSLGQHTSDVWCRYAQHPAASGTSHDRIEDIFTSLTRLRAFDLLSAHRSGITQPPWDESGSDAFLPPATSRGGENEAEPIAEATMGPLLVWAMGMVDGFAEDTLADHAETERLTCGCP